MLVMRHTLPMRRCTHVVTDVPAGVAVVETEDVLGERLGVAFREESTVGGDELVM